MGERGVRNAEVRGSIPLISIFILQYQLVSIESHLILYLGSQTGGTKHKSERGKGGFSIMYVSHNSHGNGFVFRKRIPVSHRSIFGKGQIKINLHTSCLKVAKKQALMLAYKLDDLLKSFTKEPIIRAMDQKDINRLIRNQLKQWLEDDEDIRISGVSKHTHPDDQNAELCFLDSLQAEATGQLTGQLYFPKDFPPESRQRDFPYTDPISETVDTMLADANIQLPKDSSTYRQLCRQLLRFTIPFFNILKDRARGDYDKADDDLGRLMGRLGESAPKSQV